MFRKPTVLIIGAGASVDFGFPLGPKFLKDFCGNFLESKSALERQGQTTLASSNVELWERRHLALYERAQSNLPIGLDISSAEIDEFVRVAQGATSESIDRFLRDHPEQAKIGKFLIAFEILALHYADNDTSGNRLLRSFVPPYTIRWISKLINEISEGARNPDELRKNQLSIINFNYDLNIEQAFDAHFAKTSVHRGASWQDSVDITHVYGKISELQPHFVFDKAIGAAKMDAAQISYIHEGSEFSNFLENIQKCKTLIGNAEQIAALGFAFDEANVDLLGLARPGVGSKMSALNYDGNARTNRVLRRLGVKDENIFCPSLAAEFMSIEEAISIGILS